MKNKKSNRKPSPNKLRCRVTGDERISNKVYISNKVSKLGVSATEYKNHYVTKATYKTIVKAVSEDGFRRAAEEFNWDVDTLKKVLRYNGRGAFIKIANAHERELKESQLLAA